MPDLIITASQVKALRSHTRRVIYGATITEGQAVYLDNTDGDTLALANYILNDTFRQVKVDWHSEQ